MTVNESDSPCCPTCGYLLIGLQSPRCPECGQSLSDEIESYRPSLRRTPWSISMPLPMYRGLWRVLRRPIKTLAACDNPRLVTGKRAALFALTFALLFLAIWGPLREFIGAAQVLVRDWGDPEGIRDPFSFAWRELHRFRLRWILPSVWLAWAFTRWMLLFGVLAIMLPGARTALRNRMSQRFCALLLFSPWFFLLDLMCSMTVWAAIGSCVPEPNSMFPWDGDDPAEMIRFWLIRLIVPVPLVATLFFRSVLRWRWWKAIVAGFLLIPAAAAMWMVWDDWFLRSGVLELPWR